MTYLMILIGIGQILVGAALLYFGMFVFKYEVPMDCVWSVVMGICSGATMFAGVISIKEAW
jgi:hypothetical protein